MARKSSPVIPTSSSSAPSSAPQPEEVEIQIEESSSQPFDVSDAPAGVEPAAAEPEVPAAFDPVCVAAKRHRAGGCACTGSARGPL